MTTHITLRGPGDVVAALPYQLGYHPTDSVVLVSLEGRRTGLVARCDLPPPEALPEAAEAVLGPVLRHPLTAAVLVGYESVPDAAVPLLLALVEGLERRGVDVLDVCVVRDGRRYSPVCAEPCCPPGGEPLPVAADVPAVADLVALGRAPLPDRASIDALVEPGPDAGAVGRLLRRARGPVGRGRGLRAWAGLLAAPGGDDDTGDAVAAPSARVLADAARALADVPLRDALVGWLAPGTLPREVLDPEVAAGLDGVLPRWGGLGSWDEPERDLEARPLVAGRVLSLARAVPDDAPDAAAAACTVAAHVSWSDGDGALARAAVGRALRLRPDYRLAVLLGRLVDHGVRPPSAGGPSVPLLGRAG